MALDSVWAVQSAIPEKDSKMIETPSKVGEYTVLWRLGAGEFGEVKACQSSAGGDKSLALKTITKRNIPSTNIKKAMRTIQRINSEVEAMLLLTSHPNICGLHAVLHSTDNVHLVMDRGKIDLYEYFDQAMPESEVRDIMTQILAAVGHSHAMNISHRDLKPENILVSPAGKKGEVHILLCDFGLSSKMLAGSWAVHDFAGSPGFFAPEMLDEKVPYDGRKCDVWSLGAICLEMLLGHDEFHDIWLCAYKDDRTVGRLLKRLQLTMGGLQRQLKYGGYSSGVNNLLFTKMIVVNMVERFVVQDVLADEWFNNESTVATAVPAQKSPAQKQARTLSMNAIPPTTGGAPSSLKSANKLGELPMPQSTGHALEPVTEAAFPVAAGGSPVKTSAKPETDEKRDVSSASTASVPTPETPSAEEPAPEADAAANESDDEKGVATDSEDEAEPDEAAKEEAQAAIRCMGFVAAPTATGGARAPGRNSVSRDDMPMNKEPLSLKMDANKDGFATAEQRKENRRASMRKASITMTPAMFESRVVQRRDSSRVTFSEMQKLNQQSGLVAGGIHGMI